MRTVRSPAKTTDQSALGFFVCSAGGVSFFALPSAGTITVGRGEACQLRVTEHSVSRLHARVVVGGTVTVEDAGSRHGTRVGGQALLPGEMRALAVGMAVQVCEVSLVLQRASAFRPARSGRHLVAPPAAPAVSALLPGGISTPDTTLRGAYDLLDSVAPHDVSVMVLGESGVGKEAFAESVHLRSDRRDRKCVRVDCAALDDATLDESMIAAQGGTLLLYGVDGLRVSTRAKLLRALGKSDGAVRVVSSSVLDAAALTAILGTPLREKLSDVTVILPSLRNRPEDLERLASQILEQAAVQARRAVKPLTPRVLDRMRVHSWPGNIRELKAVLERAVMFCSPPDISVGDIMRALADGSSTGATVVPPPPQSEASGPIPSSPTLVDEDER